MSIDVRIRTLRLAKGWSGPELGRRADVSSSAISSYETGRTRPKEPYLSRLASVLNVSRDFLLFGDRHGISEHEVPIIGYIGADGVVFNLNELIHYVDAPPSKASQIKALEVSNWSMAPELRPDYLVYYDAQQSMSPDDLIHKLAIVETKAGELLVKRIKRGSRRDLFDLESTAAPTVQDVCILRCSPILWIAPRSRRAAE